MRWPTLRPEANRVLLWNHDDLEQNCDDLLQIPDDLRQIHALGWIPVCPAWTLELYGNAGVGDFLVLVATSLRVDVDISKSLAKNCTREILQNAIFALASLSCKPTTNRHLPNTLKQCGFEKKWLEPKWLRCVVLPHVKNLKTLEREP